MRWVRRQWVVDSFLQSREPRPQLSLAPPAVLRYTRLITMIYIQPLLFDPHSLREVISPPYPTFRKYQSRHGFSSKDKRRQYRLISLADFVCHAPSMFIAAKKVGTMRKLFHQWVFLDSRLEIDQQVNGFKICDSIWFCPFITLAITEIYWRAMRWCCSLYISSWVNSKSIFLEIYILLYFACTGSVFKYSLIHSLNIILIMYININSTFFVY